MDVAKSLLWGSLCRGILRRLTCRKQQVAHRYAGRQSRTSMHDLAGFLLGRLWWTASVMGAAWGPQAIGLTGAATIGTSAKAGSP